MPLLALGNGETIPAFLTAALLLPFAFVTDLQLSS